MSNHTAQAYTARATNPDHPILFLNRFPFAGKQNSNIVEKQLFSILAIKADGTKELEGVVCSENADRAFWLSILSRLLNNGIDGVCTCYADQTNGLTEAIAEVFPNAKVQPSIFHITQNTLQLVSAKDVRAVAKSLKAIYTAENLEVAKQALAALSQRWSAKYPNIARYWEKEWQNLDEVFGCPPQIRRVFHTPDAIESLSRCIQKTIARGKTGNDETALLNLVHSDIRKDFSPRTRLYNYLHRRTLPCSELTYHRASDWGVRFVLLLRFLFAFTHSCLRVRLSRTPTPHFASPAVTKPPISLIESGYHKIQPFPLPASPSTVRLQQPYLFLDIFARNKELIVLYSGYTKRWLRENHSNINYEDIDCIKITLDGLAVSLKNMGPLEELHQILIYEFDYPYGEHQIEVSYKEIKRTYTIHHLSLNKTGMILHTTLFKDDHHLLPLFHNYYIKQGVDSFLWYYNGTDGDSLRKQYQLGKEVVILDWQIPYRKFNVIGPPFAQLTQMSHALYKYGKPLYEYIGFYDLDEYIKTKQENLREYILQHPNYLSYNFLNCWSRIRNAHRTDFSKHHRLPRFLLRILPETYTSHFTVQGKTSDAVKTIPIIPRSKCIHNTKIQSAIIHGINPVAENIELLNHYKTLLVKRSSYFFHITNFPQRKYDSTDMSRWRDFLRFRGKETFESL